MALTEEIQKVGGSTKQELCDRKICWGFEDEKDLKDDLEWQEKKSELNENGSDWQVSGDMLGDLSWVFYMWEKECLVERKPTIFVQLELAEAQVSLSWLIPCFHVTNSSSIQC